MMVGGVVAKQRSGVLIRIDGEFAMAYCSGTLDQGALEELSRRVRALSSEGVRGLVCSLERVAHVHYQSVKLLIQLQQFLREAGGELILTEASLYVREILEFSGATETILLLDHKAQAYDELANRIHAWASSVESRVSL